MKNEEKPTPLSLITMAERTDESLDNFSRISLGDNED